MKVAFRDTQELGVVRESPSKARPTEKVQRQQKENRNVARNFSRSIDNPNET